MKSVFFPHLVDALDGPLRPLLLEDLEEDDVEEGAARQTLHNDHGGAHDGALGLVARQGDAWKGGSVNIRFSVSYGLVRKLRIREISRSKFKVRAPQIKINGNGCPVLQNRAMIGFFYSIRP